MIYNKRLKNSVGATLCGRTKLNIAYKMKRAGIVKCRLVSERVYFKKKELLLISELNPKYLFGIFSAILRELSSKCVSISAESHSSAKKSAQKSNIVFN